MRTRKEKKSDRLATTKDYSLISNLTELWETKLKGWAWQVDKEFIALLQHMYIKDVKHVLEVGCYDGGTAAGFLEIGVQSVTSVDIAKRDKIAVLETEYKDRFKFFQGTSTDFKNAVVSGEVKTPRFDCLFIDGDHSYEWCKRDYENLVSMVAPGGMVIFHDVVESDHHKQHGCEVYKFWNEVKSDDAFLIVTDGVWGGIGVTYL